MFCAQAVAPAGHCQGGPSELPPGVYQFLGRTGKNAPRRFSISTDGVVRWDEGSAATTAGTDASKTTPEAAEEYNYPLAKWKGKRLQGSAKANGWLTTTYEYGAVKYQITLEVESGLMKSGDSVIKAAMKKGLAVELLDDNGFKIAELIIPGGVLHETSKENVAEGRGAIQMPEVLYQKTRNITIR